MCDLSVCVLSLVSWWRFVLSFNLRLCIFAIWRLSSKPQAKQEFYPALHFFSSSYFFSVSSVSIFVSCLLSLFCRRLRCLHFLCFIIFFLFCLILSLSSPGFLLPHLPSFVVLSFTDFLFRFLLQYYSGRKVVQEVTIVKQSEDKVY